MEKSFAVLPNLVIPNGAAISNVLQGVYCYHDAMAIQLIGTGTLGPETYTLEGNPDSNASNASSNWYTIQTAGADVTPPATGKSKTYGDDVIAAGSLRLKANGNVAADRTWKANKIWSWNNQ